MTKILLADDSKFLRLTIERALARAGYTVITAIDGEQAVQLTKERKPDLVLLDMLLPKLSGPEVLKALKADPETKDIAIVVFTSLSQKNASRLQKDGAYAFLEKSELGIEKGCDIFLTAIAEIVQRLGLETPAKASAAGG